MHNLMQFDSANSLDKEKNDLKKSRQRTRA